MTYIDIRGDYLDKHRKEARDSAISSYGADDEDSKHSLLFDKLTKNEVEIQEITEQGEISVSFTNELGYFSFEFKPDYDDLTDLIGVLVKKLNKMKAVVEGLK